MKRLVRALVLYVFGVNAIIYYDYSEKSVRLSRAFFPKDKGMACESASVL